MLMLPNDPFDVVKVRCTYYHARVRLTTLQRPRRARLTFFFVSASAMLGAGDLPRATGLSKADNTTRRCSGVVQRCVADDKAINCRKLKLGFAFAGASPPAFGWAASDAVLLGSLHSELDTSDLECTHPCCAGAEPSQIRHSSFATDYRLWFASLEARQRGEDVGVAAAERLSLKGHTVSLCALKQGPSRSSTIRRPLVSSLDALCAPSSLLSKL